MSANNPVMLNFVTDAISVKKKPESYLKSGLRLAFIIFVFSVIGLLIGIFVPRSSLTDPQGQDLPTLSGP